MLRLPQQPRSGWRQLAADYGFVFHTIDGAPYWDESACYQFSLAQVEDHLEAPTAALHQLYLQAVDWLLTEPQWLRRLGIAECWWPALRRSWAAREPSLYSRLDLAYDGRGPAKLLENNADTPTSLFETAFWQWLWLEQQVDAGCLPRSADQFNSLQERLIARFAALAAAKPRQPCYFAAMAGVVEDWGTISYLAECAKGAGIDARLLALEAIGTTADWQLVTAAGEAIPWLFKLYPWEFWLQEDGAPALLKGDCQLLEPLWKWLLGNKGMLALLWQLFPGHPNLLPAYLEDDPAAARLTHWVRKPFYSREGANVVMGQGQQLLCAAAGPYGQQPHVVQAAHPLPRFGDAYTLIGSWLVDDQPAGIGIREDDSPITRDSARFVPHIILG